MTQLKDFAYLPDLYGQLDKLAEMVITEPWRFATPEKERLNQTTHILERHLYLQYLLLLFIMDDEHADVALTLDAKDGFYTAYTALTLEMAYGNARLIARPEAKWLEAVLEPYKHKEDRL